jgi:hypothetical protein
LHELIKYLVPRQKGAEMPKAVKVTTSGEVEVIDLSNERSGYETIRETVGGLIDAVNGEDFTVYVHDEGLLIGLKANAIASVLTNRLIVGDVLIVGNRDKQGNYDGENHDVPAMFLTGNFQTRVRELTANEELQATLDMMRLQMGFDLPLPTE